MKQRKKEVKHYPELAGSLQPDDGLDPRFDVRASSVPQGKIDRKAAQLCSQIHRALDYIIPDVLRDTEWDAMVLDVQPAPNTGHLLVLLQAIGKLDDEGLRALELAVVQRSGAIRTAIASSIQRRKTPTLTYRFVPS